MFGGGGGLTVACRARPSGSAALPSLPPISCCEDPIPFLPNFLNLSIQFLWFGNNNKFG